MSRASDSAKVSRKIVIVKPNETFEVIWIVWFVSWMAASFWSGRTEKRATTRETWIYRGAIVAGAILMTPLGDGASWSKANLGSWYC